MSSFEFCPWTDSKADILKDLSAGFDDNDSISVLSSIKQVKKNLKNNNCDIRELSEKHVEQLKRIKVLYKKFKNEKYTELTNTRLKKVFNEAEIDINKLDQLEKYAGKIMRIENKKLKDTYFDENTFRDNIEENINFVGEYIHGTYNETPEMDEFLNLFTIEYINFLRKEKINTKIINNSKLVLSEKQLKELIIKVQNRKKDKETDFEIEFNLIGGEEKIIIKDFIKKYKKEKAEADKKAKSIKAKLEKLKQKELKYGKEKPDFNYLEEIEKSGMDEYNKKLGLYLIHNILKINIKLENKKILLNNLKVFISFIVDIESDGDNKNNKTSTAESYFQFLTGNEGINRNNGDFNSLESGLRRAYIHYTGDKNVPYEKFEKRKGLPNWVIKAYNNKYYNLREMSIKNQTSLFLIDMFNKDGTNKYLTDMLLEGNSTSMKILYEDYHHTAPDKATIIRLEKKFSKYKDKLLKI